MYVRVGQNGFVWDDHSVVEENQTIRSLGGVVEVFGGKSLFEDEGAVEFKHIYYKPMLGVWWIVNYQLLGGANPGGFHVMQLGMHLVNVAIVYGLVKAVGEKLGERKLGQWIGFWVALVWGIHPANSESVVYVAAGQEPLYMGFGLVGLWLLVERRRWKLTKYWWWVGVAWLLSLLAKESGIVMGLVGVSYVWLFEKKEWKKATRVLAGVWVVYGFLRVVVGQVGLGQVVEAIPIQRASVGERLLTVVYVVFSQLRVIFFPKDLWIGNHVVVSQIDHEWVGMLVVVLMIWGAMAWMAWRKRDKLLIWLLVWYVVATAIVSQVVALDVTFAERWVYGPSLPMIWFWVWVGREYVAKYWWVAAVLVAVLGWRTWDRVGDWKNELSLAQADIVHSDAGFDVANNLGWELYKVGKEEEAVEWLLVSVAKNPYWWGHYNNLGVIEHNRGNVEKAEEWYLQSIERGNFVRAWENLALLYRANGDGRWREVAREGLTYYPENEKLWWLSEQ